MATANVVTAEIERLLPIAHRATSRALLEDLLKRHQPRPTAPAAPAPPPQLPTPISCGSAAPVSSGPPFKPIAKYMFDQSGKFVKVYITLPGVDDVPNERIKLDVHGGGALTFEVLGLPQSSPLAPNARLAVHALHSLVDPAHSSWVRKADSTVLLKLRKETEGEEWGSLDDAARVKAKRKEHDLEQNKGKSTQGAQRPVAGARTTAEPSRTLPFAHAATRPTDSSRAWQSC